jgi:beta-lactamase class D
MIRLTISPKEKENLYGLLVQRELALRKQNKGTLHRYGAKKKNEEIWGHTSKHGWIRFQRCIGQVVVATAQARDQSEEWELLTSFVGFLDRSFRESISSIVISYE